MPTIRINQCLVSKPFYFRVCSQRGQKPLLDKVSLPKNELYVLKSDRDDLSLLIYKPQALLFTKPQGWSHAISRIVNLAYFCHYYLNVTIFDTS